MINLYDDASVKQQLDSMESQGSGLLKIENGQWPVYFLDPQKGEAGYVHWVDVDGQNLHIPCAGGVERGGFATDVCPVCAVLKAMYQKARNLEAEGKKDKGDSLRNLANKNRARYEARFVVARGEVVLVKEGGEKIKVADFEDAKVGVIALSEKQFKDLMEIVPSGKYPYVTDRVDLFSRPIIFDKGKRSEKDRYATIEFIPSKRKMDQKVEWKAEDYDLKTPFIVDMESLKNAAEYIASGKKSQKQDVDFEDATEPGVSVEAALHEDVSGAGTAIEDIDFTDIPAVAKQAGQAPAPVVASATPKAEIGDF